MAWNKEYKKQGYWQKKDKPVYKPKRGEMKPSLKLLKFGAFVENK